MKPTKNTAIAITETVIEQCKSLTRDELVAKCIMLENTVHVLTSKVDRMCRKNKKR